MNDNDNKDKIPSKGNFSASSMKSPLPNNQPFKSDLDKNNATLRSRPMSNMFSNNQKINRPTHPLIAPLTKKNILNSIISSKKTEEEPSEGEVLFNEVKKVLLPSLSFGGCASGCLIVVVLVCFVYFIFAPMIYMEEVKSEVSSFGEKLGNFLTFRGWCSDKECTEKEKTNFYEKVKDEYDYYEENYNVRINTSLIIATLTYSDPFLTLNELDIENFYLEQPSDLVNFKKSEKKVKELAKNMVTTCCYVNGEEYMCDTEDDYECPVTDVTRIKPGEEVDIYTESYKVDTEKYRKYLEDEFIRKFYYNNLKTDEVNSKVLATVEEIFERVEFFEYATGSENTSNNFSLNNTTVTIMDCTGNIPIDEVSLYDYLQGVLYLEGFAAGRSEEFLKVMAVATKNYLYALNGVSPDSMVTNLRIKSCAMNQIYCSVTEGCHGMEDSKDENYETIATGAASDGSYKLKPLTDVSILEKIKKAIDATSSEFIVRNGSFVFTQYRSSCKKITCDSTTNIMDQLVAYEMIESGSNYKEVLNYFYSGGIEQISLYVAGYPLDLKNNYVTSAYGWRVHPINNCCRHHGGTDIGANFDDNIYSIADGVVVTNKYNSSYGNYTVIGHGYNESTNSYKYYSLYAHQIRLSSLIKVGDSVQAGQKIGNVGSTGWSTGPHLHIEVYELNSNGTKIKQDPVELFNGVELEGQVGGTLYSSKAACTNQSGKGSCG